MPGILEDFEPPTREEIEAVLREHDFEPRNAATPQVWTNPEGTKFLAFPEGAVKPGTEATAIYGDAERGEPGIALTFRQAKAVVAGRVELDSPELRKLALPPPKREAAPELPAARSNVIDGEFEEPPADKPTP
jgi:hypothetical protein